MGCRFGLQAQIRRLTCRCHHCCCVPPGQAFEAWQTHGAWVTQEKPVFGPGIKERFQMAAAVTPRQFEQAAARRAAIRAHLVSLLDNDGVIALPTSPGPAPLLHTPPEQLDSFRGRLLALTCVAGLSGLPQVHLPVAHVDGCPVGLGLLGPPGSDEALLHLTEQLMGVLAP